VESGDNLACFDEARRRIKVRRQEHENRFGTRECSLQGVRVLHTRQRDLTTLLRPHFALCGVADNRAHALPRVEQCARNAAANLSSNSCNCKHIES
jgi:hypothetical protein